MKNASKSILLLTGLLTVITACENSSEPAPQTEVLSSGGSKTWKVVSIKKDGSDRFQSSCQADNLYTFYHGNDFVMDEGAKKCSTNDPQQLTGTWSISNSVITVKQGASSYLSMRIKSLTSSRLVVNQELGGETVETTFQAQ